jgi:hypothetical protein
MVFGTTFLCKCWLQPDTHNGHFTWGPESISTLICAYTSLLIHLTRTFHRCLTLNTNRKWHRPKRNIGGSSSIAPLIQPARFVWRVEICSYSAVNRQLLIAVLTVNLSNQQLCRPFYIDRFLNRRSEEYCHYNRHNHPYSNYNYSNCLVYFIV